MDSDGNSQVSASKKWLALAELTCNWQLKRVNSRKFHGARETLMYLNLTFIYNIISEETSIFAPQMIPFYKEPRVAACIVGKVRSSTVFMCVCSTFR